MSRFRSRSISKAARDAQRDRQVWRRTKEFGLHIGDFDSNINNLVAGVYYIIQCKSEYFEWDEWVANSAGEL